jgi:hypothetical protein
MMRLRQARKRERLCGTQVQLIGTDGEATHVELDDDELLEELWNLVRGYCGNLAKGDSSVLESTHGNG